MFKGLFGSKSDKPKSTTSASGKKTRSDSPDDEGTTSSLPLTVTSHTYVSNFTTARLIAYDAVYRALAVVTSEDFFICGHNFAVVALTLTD